MMKVKKAVYCRVCRQKSLSKVISLGMSPLANAFLKSNQVDQQEEFYPLELVFCNSCGFLQLGHVVSPKILFSDYVYVSSTSKVFINHFKGFSQSCINRFSLDESSLVVDIGSNDGILLKPFAENSINVVGVEPAEHIAKIAQKNGVNTISDWFTEKIANEIVKKYGSAKIVTGTNVFAHIDDLDEILKGVKKLIGDEGVFITESPYLIDFIEKSYFDLVYHEHLSYWSIKSLNVLFNRFDMEIFDVEKVPVHGGSIRVYAKSKKCSYKIEKSVSRFLLEEKSKKISKKETFVEYEKKILKNKQRLINLLIKLKLEGKKIVGYGAPAKGNTLLNYFKIGNEILDYIVDDSSFKQNLFTPGTHIPVLSPKQLKKDLPDYILILAWNFSESIIQNLSELKRKGVKFIIPVPVPNIR